MPMVSVTIFHLLHSAPHKAWDAAQRDLVLASHVQGSGFPFPVSERGERQRGDRQTDSLLVPPAPAIIGNDSTRCRSEQRVSAESHNMGTALGFCLQAFPGLSCQAIGGSGPERFQAPGQEFGKLEFAATL